MYYTNIGKFVIEIFWHFWIGIVYEENRRVFNLVKCMK
jgi:hypothetical protein